MEHFVKDPPGVPEEGNKNHTECGATLQPTVVARAEGGPDAGVDFETFGVDRAVAAAGVEAGGVGAAEVFLILRALLIGLRIVAVVVVVAHGGVALAAGRAAGDANRVIAVAGIHGSVVGRVVAGEAVRLIIERRIDAHRFIVKLVEPFLGDEQRCGRAVGDLFELRAAMIANDAVPVGIEPCLIVAPRAVGETAAAIGDHERHLDNRPES